MPFSEPEEKLYDCRKCGGKETCECRLWESSDGAYEDYQYTCRACKFLWWIEGPDA